MKTIILASLLCLISSISLAGDYSQYVHMVKTKPYQSDGKWYTDNGSCVAVAPKIAVTCIHYLKNKKSCDVFVSGKKVNATVIVPPGNEEVFRDSCILLLDEPLTKYVKSVRDSEYAEEVFVYGLTTQMEMPGMIVGNRELALKKEYTGVYEGDSGGGVFAKDGSLVGLISGYEDKIPTLKTDKEHRLVYFTRSDTFSKTLSNLLDKQK